MGRFQVIDFKNKIQNLEINDGSPELEIIKGRVLLELDRLGDLQVSLDNIPEDLKNYEEIHDEFVDRYNNMLRKVKTNFELLGFDF